MCMFMGGLVEGALPPPISRSWVGGGIIVVLDALVLYGWSWGPSLPELVCDGFVQHDMVVFVCCEKG